MLDDLYSLKLLSNLFNNLDYNQLSKNPITYLRTINADSINAFLTTIATTNYSFDSKTDPVANIIYLSLHKFQIFDKYNLPDFSADVFNIKNYPGCSWVEATETKTIPINNVDYSFSCTSIGSVRNICSLFNKIKNDFYISKIKSGDYSSLDFRSWIIDEKVRESSLGDSVLSDMYIRKLSDIYGGYIVKKISKLIPNVPAFFFDSYRYISSSLIYGSDAINGLLLGDTLYDVNDALILLTTKINENEIVANRMSDFTSLFSLNLLDNQEGLVERLSSNLKSLGKSKILSTKDTKYQFSPLGYYMYSLVEKNSEFAKFLIQGGEDSLSNLLKVKDVIHKIDNLNSINDPYTNWQEEFSNYGELILNGNNINYSFYDYSFNKDIATLRNIYDSLNNSELLHQYLIHRIKRICNDFNLSNYLRNTNGNIIYPLIFNKHLTNSPEDREYYSHDYNIIFDVLSNDDNTLNTIFLNKQLPDNITSSNAKLIYIISSLNIFKNNYHYIIYNLFNNSVFNLSKYLSSPNTYCYLEEGAITRIKEVFKSNSNFDINQDLVLLQNTLSYLETVKDLTLNNINDIKNNLNNNFFNTLFSSTYNSEYRSFLASELAAGFTMNLFSMNNEIKNHFNPYSEYNYYFSNNTYYYYINNEVGNQIDVLID